MADLGIGVHYDGGPPRQIVRYGVDATSEDIKKDDLLVWGADPSFVQQAAAGEIPMGVAMEDVTSPTSNGGAFCMVDISNTTIYAYPSDGANPTSLLVGKTMDVGGPQSIDVDASADDCIACVGVDTVNNYVLCTILTELARGGIV